MANENQTLDKAQLIGKVLSVKAVREVSTSYGVKKVVDFSTDGVPNGSFFASSVIAEQAIKAGDTIKLAQKTSKQGRNYFVACDSEGNWLPKVAVATDIQKVL
jgi:hypothetical protein